MKNIFILIFLWFLFKIEYVYAQWVTQNSNTTNILSDVHFINDSIGYIGGSGGTVLKTSDGGNNWVDVFSLNGFGLSTIYAVDKDTVYTSRISLYKSTDAGMTWTDFGGLGSWGSTIHDIYFLNAQIGFIIKSGIHKTTDYGNSWQIVYNPVAGFIDMFQFTSASIAYAAGGISFDGSSIGEIHKTTNGGDTWQDLNISTSEITAFNFINDTIGYFFNFQRQLHNTINGGTSWTIVNDSVPGDYVTDCIFLNSQIGYIVEAEGNIYKTTDGGVNWYVDYAGSNVPLSSIYVTSNKIGYVVGNNGIILKNYLCFGIGTQPTANFLIDSIDINKVYFNNMSDSACSYKWYFGDIDSSFLDNPSHTYLDTGTYNVTLIAYAGNKSDTMEKQLQISEVVGTRDLSNENKLNMQFYPNPGKNILTLKIKSINTNEIVIKIFNIQGKEIFTDIANKYSGDYIKELDTSKFSKGIYTVQAIIGNEKVAMKFIIN
ncbi:MAG: T9SS type A sorting domain-containing protein [Cytophagales bacterium]|nr:T9SS type A sorting domain-containing protein [Cytophagales bacterium]